MDHYDRFNNRTTQGIGLEKYGYTRIKLMLFLLYCSVD